MNGEKFTWVQTQEFKFEIVFLTLRFDVILIKIFELLDQKGQPKAHSQILNLKILVYYTKVD